MRTIKLSFITSLGLFFILFSINCNSKDGTDRNTTHAEGDHSSADHEYENIAVTKWTQKMELFMEYPPPVVGEKIDFIVHLTRLSDFKAVTEGTLIMEFKQENEKAFSTTTDVLLREGIFKPGIVFSQTGVFNFTIRYKGENLEDVINVGTIKVVGDHHDIVQTDLVVEVEEISFLKEQQWKIDFATEESRTMIVRPSIKATAEVMTGSESHAEIIAPVAGVLSLNRNRSFPSAGSYVKRDQIIAVLAPPTGAGNSWAEARLAFAQAKKEYERAKNLLRNDSISLRDYEKIERQYLLLKAGYPKQNSSSDAYFSIISPIEGIVTNLSAFPGQDVARGENLMTVVNSNDIRLKVNLFEKDYSRIMKPAGASIYIPGSDSPVFLTQDQMLLTGKGELLDYRTHTIPMLFKINNSEKQFKIGQVLLVDLYTRKDKQAICVPDIAVYDDDGRQSVFIQLGGESFEKRYVEIGISYFGWREIIVGIKEGERVVTSGAYMVNLASTSAPIGHGHAH